MNLTFQDAAWCYILTVPDLTTGKNYAPGTADYYGRVDPATGYPYTYVTEGPDKHGTHKVSRDLGLSLVYPERVFFAAEDDHGVALATVDELFAQLQRISFRPSGGFWHPTWLYRGWAKGATTWRLALRAHADIGPRWYNVQEHLLKLPSDAQVTPSHNRPWLDIYLDDDAVAPLIPSKN